MQKRDLDKRTCEYVTESVSYMSPTMERCKGDKKITQNNFLPLIHSPNMCRSQSICSSKSLRERSLEAKAKSDRSLDQNSNLLSVPKERKRSSFLTNLRSLY